MSTTALHRSEFAPPPQGGLGPSVVMALLAHGLLLLALSFSVQWKRDAVEVAVEAELWSAVPQEAAPRAVEPPPPPPPEIEPPKPTPAPQPQPAVKPPPAPAPDESLKDAQIALEKERKRKELEKKEREHQRELEKKEQDKKEREKREKLEKAEREKQEREKALQQKREADKAAEKAAEKKRQEQLQREKEKEQERKKQEAEAEKRKAAEADAKRKKDAEAAEAKRLEAQRADNLKRMAGLAGASGGPNATGSAMQSSGPSASYGGRIKARVKPNIVFSDDIAGNPVAEVEVRAAPDGTIVGRKLSKSSGVPAWDEAVLKAIDKTEVLPRDTDGRVPSSLIISFRPKD
ncbi:cell envelope integrity protein TolA [Curvibacter sp. HBC28]|uniref:Cell envelope integrity protein TolA n=1 Tax=Curvibacter microcysteis TaxID=3026419 RepID=A0ABT5MKW3_9BURK|nr:cell envelope integrity protein TolA [Curvibacter sp. HBC28]MDD0817153.1 cell envelope integrity protein TolA [Curvibacter sp. HBC28]